MGEQQVQPGWYDDGSGTRRWWDGRAWGAAEPMSAPQPRASSVHAGWYPDPTLVNTVRFWNGFSWTEQTAPRVAVPSLPPKSTASAYLLLIFLGGFGAHRFYLGRTASAIVLLVLYLLTFTLSFTDAGPGILLPVGIWLVVDLCVTASIVREVNRRQGYQTRE